MDLIATGEIVEGRSLADAWTGSALLRSLCVTNHTSNVGSKRRCVSGLRQEVDALVC
jgi:hypothetical protein